MNNHSDDNARPPACSPLRSRPCAPRSDVQPTRSRGHSDRARPFLQSRAIQYGVDTPSSEKTPALSEVRLPRFAFVILHLFLFSQRISPISPPSINISLSVSRLQPSSGNREELYDIVVNTGNEFLCLAHINNVLELISFAFIISSGNESRQGRL